MRCNDFLQHYSDYRDGLIADPALHRALRRHVAECQQCMRYDARIARGAIVLRTANELELSPRIRRDLVRRLAVQPQEREVEPALPGAASVMAGMMLTAAFALVVWQLVNTTNRSQAQISSNVPAAITFTGQPVSGFTSEWQTPRVTRTAAEAWGDLAP